MPIERVDIPLEENTGIVPPGHRIGHLLSGLCSAREILGRKPGRGIEYCEQDKDASR
jgi:hypothetical protein